MIDNDPQVRMQVDLSPVAASETPSSCLHAITFTLISGNIRRFRRICEHIQSMVSLHTEADRNIYSQFTLTLKTYPVPLRNMSFIVRPIGCILKFFETFTSQVCASRRCAPPASPRAQRRAQKGSEELNIFAVLLLVLLLLIIIIIIITSKDPR